MNKRISDIKIDRKKGYLYYIDKEGDVSECPMAKGKESFKHLARKILELGIKRQKGHLYFIDKEGYVCKKEVAKHSEEDINKVTKKNKCQMCGRPTNHVGNCLACNIKNKNTLKSKMQENNETIVDEFDNLQRIKKEIDEKIDKIKKELIGLAKEKNTNVLFGTHKKCSIKEYEKVVYPKDKTELINLITSKGLYNMVSSINYFKLSPKILKDEVDKEIIDLIKKEKAFRISLLDRGI